MQMKEVGLLVAGLLVGGVLGFTGGFLFTSLVFFTDFDDYMKWIELQMREGKREADQRYTRPRDFKPDDFFKGKLRH